MAPQSNRYTPFLPGTIFFLGLVDVYLRDSIYSGPVRARLASPALSLHAPNVPI
jgi:hypothetical protein